MKQMKRLTRDQKELLAKQGKDPKKYGSAFIDGKWVIVKRMADRPEACKR